MTKALRNERYKSLQGTLKYKLYAESMHNTPAAQREADFKSNPSNPMYGYIKWHYEHLCEFHRNVNRVDWYWVAQHKHLTGKGQRLFLNWLCHHYSRAKVSLIDVERNTYETEKVIPIPRALHMRPTAILRKRAWKIVLDQTETA